MIAAARLGTRAPKDLPVTQKQVPEPRKPRAWGATISRNRGSRERGSQGELGHSVDREEGAGLEANATEAVYELGDGLGVDRLGTAQGHAPGAEVDPHQIAVPVRRGTRRTRPHTPRSQQDANSRTTSTRR